MKRSIRSLYGKEERCAPLSQSVNLLFLIPNYSRSFPVWRSQRRRHTGREWILIVCSSEALARKVPLPPHPSEIVVLAPTFSAVPPSGPEVRCDPRLVIAAPAPQLQPLLRIMAAPQSPPNAAEELLSGTDASSFTVIDAG